MLFLNYKGLHSLLFLFKNSTAFSHPLLLPVSGGCLSRANYLWEDIIYLETLQCKLDWVIVTLGDSLSPLEGKICQCSPATTSYWKTVDFWPDKRFSFGWGLAVRMGLILTRLSPRNVLSCSTSYCLFSNTWRWILKRRTHAKMSMCSSVSMLNVRIDLKVFWNESVFKKKKKTQHPEMLITHLHCRMTFPFSKQKTVWE